MAKTTKAPRGLGKKDGKATKALERHAKAFIKAKEELEVTKRAKAKAEEKVKLVQKKFVEAMKDEGIQSFKIEGLGGFRTQIETFVNKTDKVALEAYIRKRKSLKFLFGISINGSKLKSWVKELQEQGKDLPPGIDPYNETQIRRY